LHEILENIPGLHKGKVFNLSEPALRYYFERALRESGITDFRIHDLRHTFASHFIMKTSNLPVLQQILGHASPKMTQRYAHLAKNHIASEMRLFDVTMPVKKPELEADGHQAQISIPEKMV